MKVSFFSYFSECNYLVLEAPVVVAPVARDTSSRPMISSSSPEKSASLLSKPGTNPPRILAASTVSVGAVNV